MKHCTICGKEFPDDVDTCDSCGYRFDSIAIIGETEPLSDKTTVFSSGSIIGGRYRVKKLIGQGGMGSVFLVHDTMLRDQKKALKVIHPRLVKNPEALQRFIDEVIICQKLNHPNIIRVFHLDRIDNFHFFTMEFLAGISLREWFNRLKDKKPPFSLTETLSIIHPLLDALSYAQHFMIRPDIKTETISSCAVEVSPKSFLPEKNLPKKPRKKFAPAILIVLALIAANCLEFQSFFSKTETGKTAQLDLTLEKISMSQLYITPNSSHAKIQILNSKIQFEQGLWLIPGKYEVKVSAPGYKTKTEMAGLNGEPEIALVQKTGSFISRTAIDKVKASMGSVKIRHPDACSKIKKQDRYQKEFTNSRGMKFVYIRPGTFMMGSPANEPQRYSDEIQHRVTLSKGFYIQKTELTVAQWRAFIKDTGYKTEAETLGGAYI